MSRWNRLRFTRSVLEKFSKRGKTNLITLKMINCVSADLITILKNKKISCERSCFRITASFVFQRYFSDGRFSNKRASLADLITRYEPVGFLHVRSLKSIVYSTEHSSTHWQHILSFDRASFPADPSNTWMWQKDNEIKAITGLKHDRSLCCEFIMKTSMDKNWKWFDTKQNQTYLYEP